LINESNRWPESIPYLEHADVRSQAKTDSETNSQARQINEGDMLGEELALQELLRSLESKRLEILASRIRIQEEAKVRADQQFESRTEEVRRQAAEASRLRAELEAKGLADREAERLAEEETKLEAETQKVRRAAEELARQRIEFTKAQAENERRRQEEEARRE